MKPFLRAVMVCVDYSDLLAYTLPWNRHHFDEILVVTSNADTDTIGLVHSYHDKDQRVNWLSTDLFYERGAHFNKWAALERGLDLFGRHGWICLMDADVLWPQKATLDLEPGYLYTPLRRMMPLASPPLLYVHDVSTEANQTWRTHLPLPFPPEDQWWQYPIHKNVAEWAGYTQIFHANDARLGPPPWHQTDWIHAGGADSFFQQKWDPIHKRRFPWDVLHLGEAGQNWMGRASPRLDGSLPKEAPERQELMRLIWQSRHGKHGPERFKQERLG